MTRDAQAVHNLLTTLNHWAPGPQTSRSNPLSYRAEPGREGPSETIECPACSGHGTFGKTRTRKCARCKGAGTLHVDAYTRQELQTARGHLRLMTDTELDGELQRIAQCVRIREDEEALDWFTAAHDRKDRQYREGSYQALEDALKTLERRVPIAYRMILMFVIYEKPTTIIPSVQRVLDATCELLADWMPKPIRAPSWAKTDTPMNGKGRWANHHNQAQRNAEVRRLRDEGLSLRKIGIQVGLTKQRVSQILGEEAA